MSEEAAGWSVVMTGFAGRWTDLADAVPRIFGREGLSVFSLTLGKDQYLPAEVAAGLPEAEARRIVADLAELGASAECTETRLVADVRHRAHEVWPTRMAGGWEFTEIEGMVLTEEPVSARRNLTQLSERPGFQAGWRYERGANHTHGDMGASARRNVESEVAILQSLEPALREAYQDRRFVVSHMPCGGVTFWQAVPGWEDALHGGVRLTSEPRNGRVWCQPCQCTQTYIEVPQRHDELPGTEWGVCSECGTDVLVRARELTHVIGPEE